MIQLIFVSGGAEIEASLGSPDQRGSASGSVAHLGRSVT